MHDHCAELFGINISRYYWILAYSFTSTVVQFIWTFSNSSNLHFVDLLGLSNDDTDNLSYYFAKIISSKPSLRFYEVKCISACASIIIIAYIGIRDMPFELSWDNYQHVYLLLILSPVNALLMQYLSMLTPLVALITNSKHRSYSNTRHQINNSARIYAYYQLVDNMSDSMGGKLANAYALLLLPIYITHIIPGIFLFLWNVIVYAAIGASIVFVIYLCTEDKIEQQYVSVQWYVYNFMCIFICKAFLMITTQEALLCSLLLYGAHFDRNGESSDQNHGGAVYTTRYWQVPSHIRNDIRNDECFYHNIFDNMGNFLQFINIFI